jgi:hypothetical protein
MTKKTKKRREKPLARWTGEDFLREAARINGVKATTVDRDSDTHLCIAMLLIAARDGARLGRIVDVLGVKRARVHGLFRNFQRGGIFTSRGKVRHGGWGDPDAGAHALILDAMVGGGLLERVTDPKAAEEAAGEPDPSPETTSGGES